MSAKKARPPAAQAASPESLPRQAPKHTMTVASFRRLALQLDGVEESSHMGAPDFRVGGRIFATLAHQGKGYGNLMLTPEAQSGFVSEQPEIFMPVAGGWGCNGATHIVLASASEDILAGALRTAWKLRVEQNAAVASRKRSPRRIPLK